MMGVSQMLTIHYLKPTRIGHWIEVETSMVSLGKTSCLMSVDIYELESPDGKRTAHTITATHTKVDVRPSRAKL